jgi:hypothetical protein
MKQSETIIELSNALAKAHTILSNPKKESVNPYFKSRYASLSEVINVSKQILATNGLSVVQMPGNVDGLVQVETVLLHSSGEYISSIMSIVPIKTDVQSVGSYITYLRRYSLAALLNLAQEDDDSNSISGNTQAGNKNKIQNTTNPKIIEKFNNCKTTSEAQDIWNESGKLNIYKKIFGAKYTELKNKEDAINEKSV